MVSYGETNRKREREKTVSGLGEVSVPNFNTQEHPLLNIFESKKGLRG